VVSDSGRVSFRHVRAGAEVAGGEVAGGAVVVLAGLEPEERVALDPVAAGVYLKRQPRESGHE
jgi:hypothetical protein